MKPGYCYKQGEPKQRYEVSVLSWEWVVIGNWITCIPPISMPPISHLLTPDYYASDKNQQATIAGTADWAVSVAASSDIAAVGICLSNWTIVLAEPV